MADNRKIVIEVLNGENNNKSQTQQNAITQTSKTAGQTVNATETESGNSDALTNYYMFQIAQQATQTLDQIVDIQVNRYYNLTEDYIGERNSSNIKQAIGVVTSFGTSLLNGAMTGAMMGGIPGAIIGAGFGAATNLINREISYNNTMASWYNQLNSSMYNINYSRDRMGLVDGGKGTEN